MSSAIEKFELSLSSVGPSPGVPSGEPVGLAGGLLDPEPPGEKMTA